MEQFDLLMALWRYNSQTIKITYLRYTIQYYFVFAYFFYSTCVYFLFIFIFPSVLRFTVYAF